MKPQVSSYGKYVKCNGSTTNTASIFAHRYLSKDYQCAMLELKKKHEQQSKSPKQANPQPIAFPSKASAPSSHSNRGTGKENNSVLANSSTSKTPRPVLTNQKAALAVAESLSKPAVVPQPHSAALSAKEQYPQLKEAATFNAIITSANILKESEKILRKQRVSGVSKESKKPRPTTKYNQQHSARGSVLGIDDSAQLERSRTSKISGTAKKPLTRANSKKEEEENAKKMILDQLLHMEGGKISQLKGRLKNITLSLSNKNDKSTSGCIKQVPIIQPSSTKNARYGNVNVARAKLGASIDTPRILVDVDSSHNRSNTTSARAQEVKVVDLNMGLIQQPQSSSTITTEEERARKSQLIAKLKGLKERLKSLLNVGARSVILVKKKVNNIDVEHK